MLIWPLVFSSMTVASQHRGTLRDLCTLDVYTTGSASCTEVAVMVLLLQRKRGFTAR